MNQSNNVSQIGIDYIGVSTPFYCHDGKGKFLFAKRSDKCRDEHGAWDTGSGKLEFGLSIAENILKEVKEEYGCSGKIQQFLPALSILRTHNGQPTHWVAIPAFVLVDPNEVKIMEPKKFTELGWFTLDNLPQPLHTGFAFTFQNYTSHFGKYKTERR